VILLSNVTVSIRSLTMPVRFDKDMNKLTTEIFFRKVKFWQGDPPPIFVSPRSILL
jgi:hypothetical protein